MQQSMVLPPGAFRVRRMCLTVLASLLVTSGLCAQMVPRRVAVVNFVLGEQAKQVTHQALGIQGDAAVDIQNELVTQLGSNGKVTLIERGELDRVMKEANIPLDEHFDPSEAVKLGKLSGAQSVLLGSVTSLSGGIKTSTVGSFACKFTGLCEQTKGEVAITISVRVVDVETGRIRTTATGEGKASETKTFAKGSKDQEYGNHLLNDAVKQAIGKVVTVLDTSPDMAPVPAASVAPPPPPAARSAYSGEILDITGDTIIFEVGSKSGAHVGDTVKITRAGKVLRDSKGAVVKTISDTIGTAKITDVDETTSTATFTAAGTVKPTKNDKAVFKP